MCAYEGFGAIQMGKFAKIRFTSGSFYVKFREGKGACDEVKENGDNGQEDSNQTKF